MTEINREEIERVKREVAVSEVIRSRGVELKRHGGNLVGLCPFHEDHEPSLVVTPAKNLWHCLGACREGGSVIDFVMKFDRISFREAVLALGGTGGNGNGDGPAKSLLLPGEVLGELKDDALLGRVVDFYHATMRAEKAGREYLAKRGVYSEEAVSTFRIGLVDRSLFAAVPAESELRSRLRDLGVLNRSNGRELFSGCIVFPLFDQAGTIVGLYGRRITDWARKGSVVHLYLPGPHRGVWNPGGFGKEGRGDTAKERRGDAVKGRRGEEEGRGEGVTRRHGEKSKEMIWCESVLDALTFWINGFTNVSCSFGVNGFTAEHLAWLKESGITRLLLAYDNDDAGNGAARGLMDRLTPAGITSSRIRFPPGLDANLYACKVTPAAKSLKILLESVNPVPSLAVPVPVLVQSPVCRDGFNRSCLPDSPGVRTTAESIDAALTEDVVVDSLESDSPNLPEDKPLDQSQSPRDQDQSEPHRVEAGASESVESGESAAEAPSSPAEIEIRRKKNGIFLTLGDRCYRVQGLEKNSYGLMKISLRVSCGEGYYLDGLDLVQQHRREQFIVAASRELDLPREVIKSDLGRMLPELERIQEELLETEPEPSETTYTMTEAEHRAALSVLESPDLIQRILSDFRICGIVNEETVLLLGYLATISRMFDDPLAIMFQASPGSGKSAVLEAILGFVPDEDKRVFTYLTGQSLFYAGENDLKHKVLAIEEDEGATKASYSLKTMQSAQRISIQSTGTDQRTGRYKSFTTTVNGPVAIFTCTTNPCVDEELMLRFVALGADESRDQTLAVLKRQRENEMLDGLLRRERARKIRVLHQNVQRLLGSVAVINPYADQLTFPASNLRTRRDQKKYLTLIRAVAFLFQYQRERKSMTIEGTPIEYIEVTPSDINLAYRLSCEVMGRTLDELAPQTRVFLSMQAAMVREACERRRISRNACRYSQRELREYTGWSAFQVKSHQHRLVELEYVYCHRGRNGRQFEYELVYEGEGDDGKPFVLGISPLDHVQKSAITSMATPQPGASKAKPGAIKGAVREQPGSTLGAVV